MGSEFKSFKLFSVVEFNHVAAICKILSGGVSTVLGSVSVITHTIHKKVFDKLQIHEYYKTKSNKPNIVVPIRDQSRMSYGQTKSERTN